jgi:hypothetical protein
VDGGEKMKFSPRTHTTDVWYQDRTYGLSLQGGHMHLSPDVRSLCGKETPYFRQMSIAFVFLDLGLL